jgi:hypothetical protein
LKRVRLKPDTTDDNATDDNATDDNARLKACATYDCQVWRRASALRDCRSYKLKNAV